MAKKPASKAAPVAPIEPPPPAPAPTREAWLGAAAQAMAPWLADAGFPLTRPYRVSCGLPSKRALSRKNKAIGECWSESATVDGVHEIFISPVMDNTMQVVGVLVHELIHAAVGLECGHKGAFPKAAKAVGLTGKMTATEPGDDFKARAVPMLATLGAYPHGALRPAFKFKTQTTRMIKVSCSECGYMVRMTRKWLDDVGPPVCPVHGEPLAEGD